MTSDIVILVNNFYIPLCFLGNSMFTTKHTRAEFPIKHPINLQTTTSCAITCDHTVDNIHA